MHVSKVWSRSWELLVVRGIVQEFLMEHGGAWSFWWRPASWVLVARGHGVCLWCKFHQAKAWCAQIWEGKSWFTWLLDFDIALSHSGCEMPWSLDPVVKHVWLLMEMCTWESSLLARDVCFMPRMKFGYDTMLNVLLLAAQHKGYVVQPWRPTLRATSLLCIIV